MTPDNHRQATQLEEQHRKMQRQLKDWKAVTHKDITVGPESPIDLPDGPFQAFRSACIAHIEAAIKVNRTQFEAL